MTFLHTVLALVGPTRWTDAMNPERIALYMCASHCQGGHSAAGLAASKALGIGFPITMQKLKAAALKDGLDPGTLWPWLTEMEKTANAAAHQSRQGE